MSMQFNHFCGWAVTVHREHDSINVEEKSRTEKLIFNSV